MSRKERERWERQLRKRNPKLFEQMMTDRERERRELILWTKRKNELIKGKTCANCEKPAQTMHHPKPRREYSSFDEYLNETNLTPACHWCHYTVYHEGNPYHMLWRRCKYRDNPEISSLPEYRQKKFVFKNNCNQCKVKDKCLGVPVVSFSFG